ncbi:hypothetical protein [Mesonia aquimarina]|uniref:hypothetical protein n=1 Tax=Mesonia aquimarina TaxID=1504967 RepID=UPI000EF59826|nr:hypothetical protein [Mesonia aquimarina]
MKTNLLNSLLLYWSFENAEIVNEGLSSLSSVNLSGFAKQDNTNIEEVTCLAVLYPLFLEVYSEKEMIVVKLKEEQDFAAFLAEIDEDLIVRLNFPLKIIINDKEEVIASEEKFLATISNQLNNMNKSSQAAFYKEKNRAVNCVSSPYIFR